ncbi:MAG TPA: V-type ATP synthase subunit A [Acidothermaceae bacterium]
MTDERRGVVARVNGPLVEVDGMAGVAMAEMVDLGAQHIPAEVVAISGSRTTLQAYEYTGGVAPGTAATRLGQGLSATMGPWLLGGVFDGLLRPLPRGPIWLPPATSEETASRTWPWRPLVKPGDPASRGATLGALGLDGGVEYLVLVPAFVDGRVSAVSPCGDYRADDELARVDDIAVTMTTRWPIRRPRPYVRRLRTDEPLVTGQRVLDNLFPLTLGGTAAVPGGFGTGKTLLLQQVAKWCSADVIVYVGCGERGNEMSDLLEDFTELVDPRSGGLLAHRTVIVANTSNMPMMARESSVYSGITVAEHFRDMGYRAVVIADSTSRWAEALREFSSRSGAMPAEEGYPADLSSSIAAFYERAGAVVTLGGTTGSVTVIGAVSPPGGDLSEPVTTLTQRYVRGLWTLDHDLAYARHYPAVSWSGSFARDTAQVDAWYARNGEPGWGRRRARLADLLAEGDRLAALAELMGATSLPDRERVALVASRLVREAVLQQSAVDANDAYCTPAKGAALADFALDASDECRAAVDRGVPAATLENFDFSNLLRAARETPPDDAAEIQRRRAVLLDALKAL